MSNDFDEDTFCIPYISCRKILDWMIPAYRRCHDIADGMAACVIRKDMILFGRQRQGFTLVRAYMDAASDRLSSGGAPDGTCPYLLASSRRHALAAVRDHRNRRPSSGKRLTFALKRLDLGEGWAI